MATSLGMKFMETSAKTRHNIENIFLALTRQIYENMPDEMIPQGEGINVNKKRTEKGGGCC